MTPPGTLCKPKKPQRPTVTNRDGFARASFLLQASAATSLDNEPLSRMYARSMDLVTKKNVLKVDPSVKRVICKGCNRLQVPSVTSSLTLEDPGRKSETFQVRCLCGAVKRFPVGKDRYFRLFSEVAKSE